jgi:beta-fructofuranosidase
MLINWTPLPENPVIALQNTPNDVVVFDPAGWRENDTYYALIGNKNKRKGYEGDCSSLFSSKNLVDWKYIGPFYQSKRKWTPATYDAACIDFFPLEDKYMVVTHVHRPFMHSQYYIGDYKNNTFIPEKHGLFSSVNMQCMAPETMLDGKGRRVFMAWHYTANNWCDTGWNSMCTLPRYFSISKNGELEQRPVEELQILRHNYRKEENITLKADDEYGLDNISGTCLEMKISVRRKDLKVFGVKVFQAKDRTEETIIGYNGETNELYVDFSKSAKGGIKIKKYSSLFLKGHPSSGEQEYISEQRLPLKLNVNENLELQIFLDQSILEVFANNRQVLVQGVNPEDINSKYISLFTKNGKADVVKAEAWDIHQSNMY